MSFVGSVAPEFALFDQDGKERSLRDYRGQKVLLYFYPKDDTSGCTLEGQNVQANLKEFESAGCQVLGVSCDSVASHKKFADKYEFTFPLLADESNEVVEAYGVWGEKSMYGRMYMGIQRDSFLIDEDGVVVKHYEKVQPKTHIEEVLVDLQAM